MSLPLAPLAPRTSARGMVVAADQLASLAGVETLGDGGTAADAAVAAATVMAVVGPHLCGMGGDMLAMISRPGEPPRALLGVGRAGSGVAPARMRAEGHAVMPLRGDVRSVTVPGAVDGWLALHERLGRLPLARVLAPAIDLADGGFAASLMLSLASHLVAGLPGTEQLCARGPLRPGERVRLPGIARALRAVVDEGRDGHYRGDFGRALLEVGGGVISPDDLGHPLAEWCDPVVLRAWGHDLWTVPPPSQGYLTLMSSWIAEHHRLTDDPSDASWAHLVVEASRTAGSDRPAVLHDRADGAALVAEPRLRVCADQVQPEGHGPARRPRTAARFSGDGDTTHLCAVDASGLGVSLTQSNALDFGSHLVAGGTGIFLHNRGVGFSLVEDHPAELAPGRRPPHTLSPLVATTPEGALTHVVGAMGGDAQPQILLQLLARMLRSGEDPATAVTAGRLALESPSAGPFRLWWGDDITVRVEAQAPAAWIEGLAAYGHSVQRISGFDPVSVGCAQIITVENGPNRSEGRNVVGAADPRSPEGGAIGR
jgi:gamma-glutamyltranspeptidase / glutathione hydrolase